MCFVYTVYMHTIQYTIRNIPPVVDSAFRKEAARSGKSFNQTIVEALTLQATGTVNPKPDQNFDWLFDQNTLDASFDQAVQDISKPDKNLWQ